LAGQEIALKSIESEGGLTFGKKYHLSKGAIKKDLILAGTGILVSLLFALINNMFVN
jgi:hypothetical protein